MTAETVSGNALVLRSTPALDGEMLRLWVTRVLTVLLILAGIVMTFYILSVVGFAVYGLPASSFRRRAKLPIAA